MSLIKESNYEIPFEIIGVAGDSKSDAMEAVMLARQGEFDKARTLLEASKEKMVEAHRLQHDLLSGEARGEQTNVNIILLHALDHMTMAIMARDFAAELIEVYAVIERLSKEKPE